MEYSATALLFSYWMKGWYIREKTKMRAICYKNTKTTLPNWSPNDPLEQHCPLGYAYETDGYFVHIYGNEGTDYTLSPGITVLQKIQIIVHLKNG